MAKNQVLGLVFSEDLSEIVLIRKNRPSFMVGKFNGVGGQIEGGESHRSAMEREFKEETGVRIIPGWVLIGEVKFDNNIMYVWTNRADISKVETKTDEEVRVVSIKDIYEPKEVTICAGRTCVTSPNLFAWSIDHHVLPDVLNTYIPAALKYHQMRMSQIVK